MTTLDVNSLTIVGMVDPAGSRNLQLKKQRSSQAIIILGADGLGRCFVLEAWKDRVKTEKFVEQMFTYCERYSSLMKLGCETNAMQELFADTTIMLAKARGIRMPLEPVQQPTRIDKTMRIRMQLQPALAYGKIFIQPHHDELRQAITTFPQCPLNLLDLVDCLASAVKLVPMRPMQRDRDLAVEGLAQYLSKAGVAPDVIHQRVQAFKQQQHRV